MYSTPWCVHHQGVATPHSSPGSCDSPVHSSLGSSDSPGYSPPGRPDLVNKRTLLVQNTLESQDSPVTNTLGSLDSLVYYSPGRFFCKAVLMLVQSTLRSLLPGVFITGESRLPGVFITGGRNSPGVFITGKSITNKNNSTNIQKNSKSFLGMPTETGRSCLMKKNRRRKVL